MPKYNATKKKTLSARRKSQKKVGKRLSDSRAAARYVLNDF